MKPSAGFFARLSLQDDWLFQAIARGGFPACGSSKK
jgi:hypothetical protein